MSEFFVLKNIDTGKYYTDDNIFIETRKEYAKKLRYGQAKNLKFKFNRYANKDTVAIEPF